MPAEENTPERNPRAKLGQEVAAQLDAIEEEAGSDFEIGTVVLVVEVSQRDNVGVRVRCNAPPWVGAGLLDFARSALQKQYGT